MHFEHKRNIVAAFVDCFFVVAQSRAVGRADIDQACARLLGDFGNAKVAADFNALAA